MSRLKQFILNKNRVIKSIAIIIFITLPFIDASRSIAMPPLYIRRADKIIIYIVKPNVTFIARLNEKALQKVTPQCVIRQRDNIRSNIINYIDNNIMIVRSIKARDDLDFRVGLLFYQKEQLIATLYTTDSYIDVGVTGKFNQNFIKFKSNFPQWLRYNLKYKC
jgi:hypothetical protein